MSAAGLPPDPPPSKPPSKQTIFESALRAAEPRNAAVTVVFDPRHPRQGVPNIPPVVPDDVRRGSHAVLQYGYSLPKPTIGLDSNPSGISAVLSFGGVERHTFVPWTAVFRIQCLDQDVWWWADVPGDLVAAPATPLGAATGASRLTSTGVRLVSEPLRDERLPPTPPRGQLGLAWSAEEP